MKYLKTYKLFESVNDTLKLESENDFEYLNDNIKYLSIEYDIKNWPKLPKHLIELNCYVQNIDVLPKLPNSLETLNCSKNNLKELPILPKKLTHLNCTNNQLKELPKLPNTLELLYCYNNKLTELPTLPESIIQLNFYNNPLEKLPNGITKKLLNNQDVRYIKENVLKWLVNKIEDYDLLKDYLTESQRKSYEENGPEVFTEMNQFGFFGLKNNKMK